MQCDAMECKTTQYKQSIARQGNALQCDIDNVTKYNIIQYDYDPVQYD